MTSKSRTTWHWPHLLLLAAIQFIACVSDRLAGTPTPVLATWLGVNLLVLGLGERWQPFRADWRLTSKHLRRDGSVWSMNLVVDAAVGAGLTALVIDWGPGENSWSLPVQILSGLLAAEFGSYWLHRWSHDDGWLWRVHVLHHLPDRLNLANAVTAHPINAAYDKLARLSPLLLLGLSPDAVLVIGLFGVTQSLAVHANVAGTIGPLEWLVGSAKLHRLHHSRRPEDAGNFGTALPIWDLVFRTYRRGSTPRAVGVFEPKDYPTEFELGRLLRWPFCPRAARRFACC